MKKLPLSLQNFEELIAKDCVYVDKTRLIYKMATEGKFYFLSRPRRFGKSLLVSTLKRLFEGKKDLFRGLWIENANWDWKPHPVLYLDFSEISNETSEKLKEGIGVTLTKIAEEHGLSLSSKLLPETFKELIVSLSRKAGEKVVVLFDEYDKPLISHLGKGEAELEIAKQNREVLRNFFGVLKGGNVNEALQFVFVTGISKFARVSIFSELNNLNDLTMHPAYAELLGYTQHELEFYFAEHLAQLAEGLNEPLPTMLKKLKARYNGYRFTVKEVLVYNPFSILNVFEKGLFQNYWFETATPSFLVNLIKEKKYPITDIENLQLQEASFSAYDLDHLDLEPLLLQTGYLTIHAFDGDRYRLGYPNQEVKSAFLSYLYKNFSAIPSTALREQYSRLHEYLAQEDLDSFIATCNAILSAIPYPHIEGQDEHFYHTVFYLMVAASGVLVQTEVLTSRGRIDMEVYFPERVYIVELKCNQSAEQAIAQIKAKKYFEKHLSSGKKILLLGINFSTQERCITEWRLEEMKL
ncbi:MAG: AAA family ATPase [candidate division KSB1 bacterium]